MSEAHTDAPSGPTIFVGNLPQNCTSEELAAFLNKDGKTKVTGAKIIKTSNSRKDSRVFAFVTVATEPEIQKVIDAFHDQEFQGQKLVLQVALPPRERKPRAPKESGGGGGGGDAHASASGNNDDAQDKKKRVRHRKRGGRGGGSGAAADGGGGGAAASGGGAAATHVDGGAAAATGGGGEGGAAPHHQRPRNRGPRGGAGRGDGGAADNTHTGNTNNSGNTNANSNSNTTGGGGGGDGGRRPRAPRAPRAEEPHERIDPTNTLFVANLPFSIDEAALTAHMSIPNGKVTVARIVRVRYNNRSKGFGFVSYDSTGARDAALAAKNAQLLEGRALSVSIAKEEKPEKTQ